MIPTPFKMELGEGGDPLKSISGSIFAFVEETGLNGIGGPPPPPLQQGGSAVWNSSAFFSDASRLAKTSLREKLSR